MIIFSILCILNVPLIKLFLSYIFVDKFFLFYRQDTNMVGYNIVLHRKIN